MSSSVDVWTAGASGALRRSSDGGDTFTALTNPAGTRDVMDIEVAAGTTNVWAQPNGADMIRSTDGSTFASVAGTFSNSELGAIASWGPDDLIWWNQCGSLKATFNAGTSWTDDSFGGCSGAVDMVALSNTRVYHLIEGGSSVFLIDGQGSTVSDYQSGAADFGVSGAGIDGVSSFGACIQSAGAAVTVAAPWVEDSGGTTPGECVVDDSDPWRGVSQAPEVIASLAAPGTDTLTIVWGVRMGTAQPAGAYEAVVAFEAVAPNI